jgi:general secretion pathway protein H
MISARRRASQSGVTLLEMMTVVVIIALMAGLSFPSFSGGMDGLRLRTAAATVASALNVGLRTAERRQLPVELLISTSRNEIVLRVPDRPNPQIFSLVSGVRISRILPALYVEEAQRDRYLVIYPNGAPPQMLIELRTPRGAGKLVRLDPFTNNARVSDATEAAPDAAN